MAQTLVTTSQEHRTKETLFATPERRAPEASGSGAAADARRLRKRQSPQSGAAEPGADSRRYPTCSSPMGRTGR